MLLVRWFQSEFAEVGDVAAFDGDFFAVATGGSAAPARALVIDLKPVLSRRRQLDLEEPAIILLSTRLSDMSGLELLQRLREFAQTPVIMLCDACDEDERVRLFDLGADDLVLKPFGMKELLARVRALLRRQSVPEDPSTNHAIFTTGDLTIDYAQHLVLLKGCPVQLSRTEYKLLSTLAHNVGIILTHEVLLERVWGPEYNREVDFIWVYVSRLRRKIEKDPRHPQYILTMPDVGYKLAKI